MVDGVEQIRIPVRRNWFVLLFVSFWIVMWTLGGGVAMYQAVTTHDLFLLVWLCFWALGWCFAAATIASQVAGSEVIRVVGRDLELGIGVGKLVWRRRYRSDHIRNLSSSDPNPWGMPWRMPQPLPIGRWSRGAIKFDYGARTIYAATSAEEAEGRMIVDWLAPKLPRSATEALGGSANLKL
jgi:hypothetical protein